MASINGNEILENLKIARNKTPKHFGTISQNGKVLASAQGSKPVEAEPIKHKLSPKQSFLNQIQNYNDFIVQNDLDAEKINPGHDYDFTAFTSPEDWKVESQRLKDRFSDRQAEIKQNANNGEFQGLELEGSVPSYEAVQNMDDEEYANYEKKYLRGEIKVTPDTSLKERTPKETVSTVTTPIDAISATVSATSTKPPAHKTNKIPSDVGSRLQGEDWSLFSPVGLRDFAVDGIGSFFRSRDEGRDPRYVPKEIYIAEQKRKNLDALRTAQYNQKMKDQNITSADLDKIRTNKSDVQFSALDRIKSIIADQSFPVVKGVASTVGSVARLKNQYEKEGAGSMFEDVANGTMARFAQPFSDSSSKFWRARLNTKDGEAGNVGSAVADEAMMGLGGGLLGRAVGTGYRSMRRGGEMLRHRATKAGKARQKLVNDHIDYGHKFLTNIGMPSNIAKGKISAKDAEGTAHRVYENMSKPLKHKPYGGSESLGSTLTHNIRRKLDSRAMLQRNDNEINSLFNQGKTLKQAKSHQKKHWESQPNQYQQIGAVMGGGLGLAGNTGL